MKHLLLFFFLLFIQLIYAQPSLVVLGTLQDAGSPQIGCTKSCCKSLFTKKDHKRKVVSLGIFDSAKRISYLIEASPDISTQLRLLQQYSNTASDIPNGIFLTHAHIGHYAGLMYLGKEAYNTSLVPVYAMPRMLQFLTQNGPWSQLVSQKNIQLQSMTADNPIALGAGLQVTPFLVPHRDEFSETVGYTISGPNKKALFIPDIDKWEKWNRDISTYISTVDYAFIDATFFDAAEINNRDIREIPHPLVIESMKRFGSLPASEKKKIHFIHFNHTNPLLLANSKATKQIQAAGFNVAIFGSLFKL